MRRTMVAIPILLALGATPAVALPALYTIGFTLTSGAPLPVSGSFSYDSSTGTFANFDVLWDGDSFDFTSVANASPSVGNPGCSLSYGSGTQELFQMLTACPSAYWVANSSAVSLTEPSFLFDDGPFDTVNTYGLDVISPGLPIAPPTTATGAFTSTISPEPGTWALTLIGLGLALRKRMASRQYDRRSGMQQESSATATATGEASRLRQP